MASAKDNGKRFKMRFFVKRLKAGLRNSYGHDFGIFLPESPKKSRNQSIGSPSS
jgi:hypothetical protein